MPMKRPGLANGSILAQDTGFQGFALPNVTMLQPKKKPRGKELLPKKKKATENFKLGIRVETPLVA